MQVERLICGSCGAPLEVPQGANFVTCNHCATSLAIRRTESTTFTEQLADLAEKTEELSDRVDDLAASSELSAIDREWQLERESLLVSDKHGNKHVPTKNASVMGGIGIAVFGCFWTAMAIGITSMAPNIGPFGIAKVAFPAFGVLFVVGGIATSMHTYKRAERYERAERRYRTRRADADRE